jgi:hypothetical protein
MRRIRRQGRPPRFPLQPRAAVRTPLCLHGGQGAAERTLAEVWKGAATSDVFARSRGDYLCRYQEERRCACASRKGSREGCSFAMRFET